MKKIALITLGKLPEDTICEPLQLGYLAAFLKERGISVTIIDQAAGDDIDAELARYAPDYVGVTATTPLANEAYSVLDRCRKQGYRTVIGGVHASTMPEEALQHADYVVVGEGEAALHTIITEEPPHGVIKGGYIKDLDDVPFPDRSLIDMEYYLHAKLKEPVHIYYFLPRGMRMATLITSRGCPHNCVHCHNSWRGIPTRYQSAECVYREMVEVKEKYNAGAVFFMDDDLFANKPRMMELCEKLRRGKIGLLWAGNARVSSVDKEVLEAARSAGCRQINYGVESGSQKVLDALNKKTTVAQAREALRLTREAGLLVYSSFMLGSPGETLEDIERTKEFMFNNPIDSLSLSITTPYPGTALWEHCKKHTLIPDSFRWDDFRFVSEGRISASEFFSHEQLERMRFRLLIRAFFKLPVSFCLYYLKYPSFLASKIVEAFHSLVTEKEHKHAGKRKRRT